MLEVLKNFAFRFKLRELFVVAERFSEVVFMKDFYCYWFAIQFGSINVPKTSASDKFLPLEVWKHSSQDRALFILSLAVCLKYIHQGRKLSKLSLLECLVPRVFSYNEISILGVCSPYARERIMFESLKVIKEMVSVQSTIIELWMHLGGLLIA